ncbi:hypothetical protein [Rubrivirga sp.]|uniref:hypothetical protein n=1 Tax=Rubrivirga sp. TaxID=1885344 RepID=UPI003B5202E7
MSERTYSEGEIADLIARAAERQRDARQSEAGAGLTLAEIERVGRDTGIDPAHLRAAAAEMDAAGRTLARQSGHTRTHVTVERWIDAPLTPEAWEEAVAELQGRHGVDASFWLGQNSGGTVQQVGNAYEWRHTSSLGIQTTVTASPRSGRTRLRLRQLVGLASPTAEGVGYGFFLAVVAAPFGGWLADTGWGAALAFLAVWLVAAPLIMALDRRWRAGKLRDLETLADDVAVVLAAPVGEALTGATPSARTATGPAMHSEPAEAPVARLDLSALDDAPPAEDYDAGGPVAERGRQRAG